MEADIVFLGVKTCGWGQRSVISDLIRNLTHRHSGPDLGSLWREILNPVQDDRI